VERDEGVPLLHEKFPSKHRQCLSRAFGAHTREAVDFGDIVEAEEASWHCRAYPMQVAFTNQDLRRAQRPERLPLHQQVDSTATQLQDPGVGARNEDLISTPQAQDSQTTPIPSEHSDRFDNRHPGGVVGPDSAIDQAGTGWSSVRREIRWSSRCCQGSIHRLGSVIDFEALMM
jgi:hypothetical protein